MKRAPWIAFAALAALVVVWALRPRARARDGSGAGVAASRTPDDAEGSAPGPARPVSVAGAAVQDAVRGSGAPGSTPPLAVPASERDGYVEVRVLAVGKPAGAASVRLYWRGPPDRNTARTDWRFAGAAETGRDGFARIPARPGAYLAVARSPGFAPARRHLQRAAGEAITRVVLALSPGAAVTGTTVQKGSGEPVPLALVTLTYAEGPFPRVDAPAEEQARATADASGRFRIEGLERGSWRATAQAPGYAKASARVEVPGRDDIVLQLAPASFIEGQVVAADGAPAPGAEVIATGAEDAVTTVASVHGNFSLEVTPRTWTLAARRGEDAGRADAPITVAAGATARAVKIRLGAGSGIAGTVVAAATRQPIAGAQIAVSPHDSNGDSGRGVSDATGAFAVTGLPPGSYDVAVSADGFADVSRRGVTVSSGERFPLRVELRQNGAVEGVVRDASGRSVAYALVRASAPRFAPGIFGTPSEARTDESGAYRLTGVSAGHGSFVAARDGSPVGATASVDVPEGGTAKLDFQLKDEGVLTGRVLREDGSPAPADAMVRVAPADGRGTRADWVVLPVDASSTYVASVPAGTYVLTAWSARSGPAFRNRRFVTVEAGRTAAQDLIWSDAEPDDSGFSGVVLEPGGAPSPDASVRGTGGTGRFGMVFGTNTDESGRFDSGRQRADLPDTFEVVAMNGGRTGRATVGPQQSSVTVQLLPAATLRGHLPSAVDSFQVVLSGPQYGQQLEFTGDRFEVRDVPGMQVHVVVTTSDGRSAALDVALSPGAAQDVEVPLQPLATVTGRIVDAATRAALPDVALFADQGGFRNNQNYSVADGRFQLQIAAGDHQLRGFLPAYDPLAKPFTTQAGQAVELGDVPMQRQTTQPGSIGATLRADSETSPMVVSLIPGGPAETAGVHLGDGIAAVDGKPVASVPEAVSRLQGAPGSAVQVTLQRSGIPLTVQITRAP